MTWLEKADYRRSIRRELDGHTRDRRADYYLHPGQDKVATIEQLPLPAKVPTVPKSGEVEGEPEGGKVQASEELEMVGPWGLEPQTSTVSNQIIITAEISLSRVSPCIYAPSVALKGCIADTTKLGQMWLYEQSYVTKHVTKPSSNPRLNPRQPKGRPFLIGVSWENLGIGGTLQKCLPRWLPIPV
jgi:hypothetical protein